MDWTVVKPLGQLLVTPSGYAVEEQFQRLAASGVLDPLPRMSRAKGPDETQLVAVSVSVDSVIYEDGAVWGPDTLKYYLTLMNRRSALEMLFAELKDAKGAGEDFNAHLEKIRKEIPHSKDQRTLHRRDYAGMLQRNPNPEALLKQLEALAPLPEFHHIGGEN